MTTFLKSLLVAGTAALFTTSVMAQTAPDFATADANGDGALTLEEVKAALPNVEEANIVAADANNDGSLSTDEYTALIGG